MSPSPTEITSDEQFDTYRRSWQQITDLTRAGKSFSGRERNCCYLNTGSTRFANVSAVSGFDFDDDARALGLVDWDHDGDLDVWVSNRTGPQIRFMRNESPPGRHFVGLKLTGIQSNRDAIGARVEVELTKGSPRRLFRSVRAGNGFVSQSSKRIHFGLGERQEIKSVTVRWPNGRRESIQGVTADTHFEIVEGTGVARKLQRPARGSHLMASKLEPLPAEDSARLVLGRRVPSPRYLFYKSLSGESLSLDLGSSQPRLILLWSTTCPSCLKELARLAGEGSTLQGRNLQLLALNIDALQSGSDGNSKTMAATLERIGWPYAAGIASKELVDSLEQARLSFVLKQGPLNLPTSFLFDAKGQLAVIYKGPVEPEQLSADLKLLSLSQAGIFQAACPFKGRWNPEVPRMATRPQRRR